jgi:hypothetical protein
VPDRSGEFIGDGTIQHLKAVTGWRKAAFLM